MTGTSGFVSRGFRFTVLWPALAAIPAAALLLGLLLPGLLRESTARSLRSVIPVVSPLLVEKLYLEPRALQSRVEELGADTSLRITLVALDGTVLADSARTQEQLLDMENHASRPEVRQALETGAGISRRRSATTSEEYIYVAKLVGDDDSRRIVLRLAQPLPALAALQGQLVRILLLATIGALLAAGIAWFWLDRRLGKPLADTIEVADRMAGGDYSLRIPAPATDDLAPLVTALNRLAARVEEQLGSLTAERGQLTEILSSMSEGVLVVDRDGMIVSANPAFRQLLGPTEGAIGRHTLEALRLPALTDLIDETLGSGRGQTARVEDGLPQPGIVSLNSSPLTGGAGAVVVARDVSDLVRFYEIRRDLVANVSHELKTPLTAIRGYAETLRDGAVDDAEVARGFLDRILAQCERLEALLKDLLTLSRLERSGKLEESVRVDLGELVAQAIEVVGARAAESEITISATGEEQAPVLGDPEMLSSLVLNLIDNAVKYNRRGGSVKVCLSREPDRVNLEVVDSGIGIPRDALARVFERFFRVDKGRSRAEGGTGLGLAIVKHAAQLHGGTVHVESEIGRGSRFRVSLPPAG